MIYHESRRKTKSDVKGLRQLRQLSQETKNHLTLHFYKQPDETIMLCIHRLPKKNGNRCQFECVHDTQFCASHRRFCGKPLFYDADTFFGEETELTASNIFSCCSRIWTKYSSTDVSVVQSCFVVMEVLSYVLNHQSITVLVNQLAIKYERGQKQTAVMEIVLLMRKLWYIHSTPRLVKAVSVLQQKVKKALLPDMGPYPQEPAVNREDIFTLDPLNMIDAKMVFSFRDNSGRVFAFHAGELAKHVFVFKNAFNPLNRDPMALADLIRLKQWANIYAKDFIDVTIITKTWETPMLAFTEITSEFERAFGIFTQPSWYIELDQFDIMQVFSEFHKTAGTGCIFMDRESEEDAFVEGDATASQLVLAREMYRIGTETNADNHLFFVCCLFVSLSQVCVEIADSLPQWIYDVVAV